MRTKVITISQRLHNFYLKTIHLFTIHNVFVYSNARQIRLKTCYIHCGDQFCSFGQTYHTFYLISFRGGCSILHTLREVLKLCISQEIFRKPRTCNIVFFINRFQEIFLVFVFKSEKIFPVSGVKIHICPSKSVFLKCC